MFIRCVFFPFSVYKLIDIFTTFCRVAVVVVVGGFAGRAQSRTEPRLSSTIHYPLSTIPIHILPPASFLFPTTTAAYIELLHSPRPRPRPFWVSKVIRYIFGQQQLIPTGCVCFHLQLHFSNDPESPPYHYIHVYTDTHCVDEFIMLSACC